MADERDTPVEDEVLGVSPACPKCCHGRFMETGRSDLLLTAGNAMGGAVLLGFPLGLLHLYVGMAGVVIGAALGGWLGYGWAKAPHVAIPEELNSNNEV